MVQQVERVRSDARPSIARRVGEAIAREACVRGFNVLLAPGANLTSEVRNRRNHEHNLHWQDAIVDRAGLREAEMQRWRKLRGCAGSVCGGVRAHCRDTTGLSPVPELIPGYGMQLSS